MNFKSFVLSFPSLITADNMIYVNKLSNNKIQTPIIHTAEKLLGPL